MWEPPAGTRDPDQRAVSLPVATAAAIARKRVKGQTQYEFSIGCRDDLILRW
jgi:hypothetical protein